MDRLVLAALLIVVSITSADAWHRRHRGWGGFDAYGAVAPDDQTPRSRGRTVADMLPPDWQQQPKDPKWDGVRYLSPDGAAWAALYRSPADRESQPAHMQSVAFAEGETITYIRGERDWIAVSGLKQDKIFYRKAALGCDGKTWQHIAFEYPADMKRRMDRLVIATATALDVAARADCDAVSSR